MMDITEMQHWTLRRDPQDIAKLVIDQADNSVNTLSAAVLDELEAALQQLEQQPPKGLIIASAKTAGFFAGADISEFAQINTRGQDESQDQDDAAVRRQLERGQTLFMRLQQLPCITVALIHGHCLGGGLELALACDYRIADKDRSCKLGLPEVKLGIHPGYGGVVRLSRLIDPFTALNLMLAGRVIPSHQARKQGIVDVVTEARYLEDAAQQLLAKGHSPRRHRALRARMLDLGPVRRITAHLVQRQLHKRVYPKHYPAPYRLLELWRDLPADDSRAYQAETDSFLSLLRDSRGRRAIENLVRVFLLDGEMKNRAKQGRFDGRHVHVIGAGVMGGDIAAWCALQGFHVTLQDAKAEFIAPAIGRANTLFQRKLRDRARVTAARDRLVADPKGHAVSRADIVIEAISENLEAKRAVYAATEPRMKATALLATNTSSIPLEELSQGLKRPQQLVGIHFFNPVAQMQLVEVVRGQNTSDSSVKTALAFVNNMSKLPLEVTSAPGFLVNRVLMTYLSEAMRLYQEGVPAETIDAEAVAMGMPMGPIELADTVGLDICLAVAAELQQTQDDADSSLVQDMVDKGKLGRKSGQGFYRWDKGKAKKKKLSRTNAADAIADPDIRLRLMFSMLNESVQCLADGIVNDADSLDIGMIFGTGFPPFQGGPIQYIRSTGKQECLDQLHAFEVRGWERFAPKPGWEAFE